MNHDTPPEINRANMRTSQTNAPSPSNSLRSPFYEAVNSARYGRQALIQSIQQITQRPLIAYVSGETCSISRDDTIPFVDLLHWVPPNSDLDLLLHTGGGDIDAAEKLVFMMRKRVGSARLRMIVPDYAKSAGTLMALGCDSIVMSDTSELGPIDPQITRCDINGNLVQHSILHYLQAYDKCCEDLKVDPNNVAARIMLGKLDPETVKLFHAVKIRTTRFAESFLLKWMFREKSGNYTKIAADLMNNEKWPNHGQLISVDDARDLGLIVEESVFDSPLWSLVWRLYSHQRICVASGQKLFESERVFLPVDVGRGGATPARAFKEVGRGRPESGGAKTPAEPENSGQ